MLIAAILATSLPSPTISPAAPAAFPVPAAPARPTPIPLPTPVVLGPEALPQILDLRISSTTFHSGETITGTVITSTNVASLEMRVSGVSIPVPRTDFGVFAMTYKVPKVPRYARHGYTMRAIARNAKGDRAERDIQITLR